MAAFLRVIPSAGEGGFLGCLFLVNALGEPLEFTYNRIEVRQRFLWRRDGLRRHAARALAASLFETCPRVPDLLLCVAREIEPELFAEDLQVGVPVARVADQDAVVGVTSSEDREASGDDGAPQLIWQGRRPEDDAPARALVDRLARRGLLLEPFERAWVGLREVYELDEPRENGDDVVG